MRRRAFLEADETDPSLWLRMTEFESGTFAEVAADRAGTPVVVPPGDHGERGSRRGLLNPATVIDRRYNCGPLRWR